MLAKAVLLATAAAGVAHGGSEPEGGGADLNLEGGSQPQSCTFAPDDYNAARTLKSISAATPAECCAGCAATPSCEAGILDAAGQCYLKAGLQQPAGCDNCTSCTPAGRGPAAALVFGPRRFKLRINPATLGLQNISVSSANGAFTQGFTMNSMAPPKRTEYSLWRLNITDCKSTLPQGTRITPCLGADCANTSHALSADGSTLSLRWQGVPLPPPFGSTRLDVTVTIAQLPGGKPGVSLRGAVGLSPVTGEQQQPQPQPAVPVCLQNLALPTLDGILLRSNATDAMFVPDFFGHAGPKCGGNCKMDMLQYWDGMIDHETGTKEYAYMPNGNSRSMQWFAFYSNHTTKRLGLYAGAHDAGSHLQLAMSTGAWPGGAALHWHHIPDNPLAPLQAGEPWEMKYAVVLQGFEGDWYDAAQIYREWALVSADWTRKGDVATRLANKQLPAYLTTTPLLIESNVGRTAGGTYGRAADPNDTVESMVKIMAMLGVREMINWWSSWNTEFYDSKYPQFTARAGFEARVKQMRAAGIHVVPYTNGRLFDPEIAAWNATNASAHMCVSTGGPYRETCKC
eukprot:SAG22_NODE_1187_length_5217_cov_5.282532_4_plen_570_part_00